jgi:hypothetical protein
MAFLLAVACAPDTQLLGEGVPPDGAPGATAGAAVLVDPTPGAATVPLNLAAVLVRFPGVVSLASGVLPPGAMVVTSGGRAVVADAALAVECPGAGVDMGVCYRSALGERLMPSSTYLVTLGPGVVDGAGHTIAGGWVGQFITGAEADLTPPAITNLSVTPSGPCALISFQTDEVASATFDLSAESLKRTLTAGAGTRQFSAAVSLAAFGGGNDVQVVVRAADLAGNIAESAAVTVTVPVGLTSLAITEVLANPAGPEPTQEYVELRNLGPQAVDVGGLTIEDSKGADILPASLLDPGAYALVVAAGFDPAAGGDDTPPRPGTALLRVDARIGGDGLANGGEMVRLRDAAGTVLTSYGSGLDVSSSKWSGKGVHRVPQDTCDQAASWTRLPLPATPGAGPP